MTTQTTAARTPDRTNRAHHKPRSAGTERPAAAIAPPGHIVVNAENLRGLCESLHSLSALLMMGLESLDRIAGSRPPTGSN